MLRCQPILFLSILCILLSNCSSKTAEDYIGFPLPMESMDDYLEAKMQDYRIPGLSIAVIDEGKVIYRKAFGYANIKDKIPVTDTTIFEAASLSKSVFAMFVMTYVEEGKLDLDRPLFEYLPHPDIAYDERYKKITARMVLSHRSGFPNWREIEEDQKLKIKFDPGTAYEYSGEGYQYLANVLRTIEGTDWEGLEASFQQKIAKPLGLEHTAFIQTPDTRAHKAEPYDGKGNWIDWKNNYWYKKHDGEFNSAASLHTEPLDFSGWMIAVMNKELLTEKSYAELLKRHSDISNPDGELYYTLGFFNLGKPYDKVFFHGGNNDGFSCYYLMDLEKKRGYVLFTNSESGGRLGNDLADLLIVGK
jgi:CubicO group peptidase (beta-lactamase class C family)